MNSYFLRAAMRAFCRYAVAGLAFCPLLAQPTSAPSSNPSLPNAPEAEVQRRDPLPSPKPAPERDTKYHWRGLIWQTLEFNVVENGFRLASDDTMRFQISHKPFWHDYVSSLHQFNMRRWNDGDDFLVNYVGHPMQGAVSGYIEIQNSPTDSMIQWNEPGYFRSRFKAFLWATVFSTNEKIGPTGEAGIGNDGGFTYGTECMEHCDASNFGPGDHYTNNTGWVDFIITPTIGTLWIFAEDFIDKDISPHIFGDKYPLATKIVRGSLNPTRTFANLLRGRNPWYRDYDHPITYPAYGQYFDRHLPSQEDMGWRADRPRYQIAPHVTGLSMATTAAACTYCRTMTTGAGLEFSARLLTFLDFDGDLSYQPEASAEASDRAGGNALRGVFGVRAGYESPHFAVRLALRPGFVRWDRAYTTSPTTVVLPNNQLGPDRYVDTGSVVQNPQPTLGPIVHFDWNANVTADYKLTPELALRAGIGEDLIRYRTNVEAAPGIGEPPYLSWLSHENYINRGNWSYQLGPVISF